MAYFARTTLRAPPSHINALLMGRKTWESIPARLRPLKGRVNVVVTRRGEELFGKEEGGNGKKGVEGPWAVGSLREGWEVLGRVLGGEGDGAPDEEGKEGGPLKLGRVFVIGGAEIYAAALGMPNCRRVLLTRVWTEFECDTFFPVRLGGGQGGKSAEGWVQRSKQELDGWVGEVVPPGRREEKGVEWEFEMWEREGEGKVEKGGGGP